MAATSQRGLGAAIVAWGAGLGLLIASMLLTLASRLGVAWRPLTRLSAWMFLAAILLLVIGWLVGQAKLFGWVDRIIKGD